MKFNHIAIQTDDVDATITWYREFLGATVEWELDTFSELTHARLPGIKRLVELRAGDVRLRGPDARDYQFQHVGILVDDPAELVRLRERWLRAREATDLKRLRDDPPSEIVTDADGMQSLYVLDPNGLEFEFLSLPGVAS